jgi:hypothetical protein
MLIVVGWCYLGALGKYLLICILGELILKLSYCFFGIILAWLYLSARIGRLW